MEVDSSKIDEVKGRNHVEALIGRAAEASTGAEAMHFAQAALNAVHAITDLEWHAIKAGEDGPRLR